MEKFYLTVIRKNGSTRTVAVYLDDTTAELLKQTGDPKLIDAYLLEEYKASRKARQARYWNRSLDEDLENGIDYEDKPSSDEISFDDFEDKDLQAAFKQLTPRQQEILRLLYIEGKTQTEIAEIFGVKKQAICNAVKRIYDALKKNYKKS